ncbi:hypothetical protein D9T17_00550 [Lysobacter enzymogenes]|uniref:Type 1 fimbrial protein n=1 Tax=Lysobacter enzymogenes TaxID=69 RepID=A0A3N2RPF3_LYSEN|nr:hypothetical protein D9T17_00550 [Lysobacter enzymogenes]
MVPTNADARCDARPRRGSNPLEISNEACFRNRVRPRPGRARRVFRRRRHRPLRRLGDRADLRTHQRAVAGRTPFIIRVAACDAATTQVQTFFEPGPTINTSNNNLTLAGGAGTAAHVELQVLNANYSQVLLGNPLALQNSEQVAVDTGGAALRYYAQYYAPGAASAGSANSSVTFTKIYQ